MKNTPLTSSPLKRLRLSNPVHFLSLGFGSGLLKPMPGTWGTLAGLLVAIPLLQWLSLPVFALFTVFCFCIGCYLCQKTAQDMGVHDHGAIVWDEFVGIFIVLMALPNLSWNWLLTAFVLFRIFDIFKPYPIKYFDQKLESGFGIMLDDVLAAIYAVILLLCLRSFS